MIADMVWRMLSTRDISARRVMRPISSPAITSTPMAHARPIQKRCSSGANRRLSRPTNRL